MTRARRLGAVAGFTLIEILVVLTIIAAIIGIAVPIFTAARDTSNLTICKKNLSSLGQAMTLYHQRFKGYPSTRSGVQFLLAPLRTKVVDYDEETIEKTVRNMYVCPGDDVASGAIGGNVWEAYRDLDNIQPECLSYAGRNSKEFPLRQKNAGKEVIAADAGGHDGRVFIHRSKVNILYLDGSVQDIDILELPDGDESKFEVGPNSPLERLRMLNKDT
ncbi:MAG: prepilin-type N-terminal cleavage/methylation domain-containing protein [Planctomycetes bacterium]|nr:prepilin-type N-terminal cleavage/methylation domain-containing protein [Planctomycetota bacterium]